LVYRVSATTSARVAYVRPPSAAARPGFADASMCRPISLSSYENTIVPLASKNCVATTS
jgi:hypothetical protein